MRALAVVVAASSLLVACETTPKYEYKPIQVDYTAQRERERRSQLLMEQISACEIGVIRPLIKSTMTPNEIVNKAEDDCKAQRDAWAANQAGPGITQAYAANVLNSGTCSRSMWTRYISLVRGGANAAEIRDFTNTFQCR